MQRADDQWVLTLAQRWFSRCTGCNCFLFCSVSRTLPISLRYLSCSPDFSRCGPVPLIAHRIGRPIYNDCRPSFCPAILCTASHSAGSGLGQLCNCPSGCISLAGADIETARSFGPISIPTSDLEITVEPVERSNPIVPTRYVVGCSADASRSCGPAAGCFRTGRPAQATSRRASVITVSTRAWARLRTKIVSKYGGHPLRSKKPDVKQAGSEGLAPVRRRLLQS